MARGTRAALRAVELVAAVPERPGLYCLSTAVRPVAQIEERRCRTRSCTRPGTSLATSMCCPPPKAARYWAVCLTPSGSSSTVLTVVPGYCFGSRDLLVVPLAMRASRRGLGEDAAEPDRQRSTLRGRGRPGGPGRRLERASPTPVYAEATSTSDASSAATPRGQRLDVRPRVDVPRMDLTLLVAPCPCVAPTEASLPAVRCTIREREATSAGANIGCRNGGRAHRRSTEPHGSRLRGARRGHLRPDISAGGPVSIDKLATRLGISVTPVRGGSCVRLAGPADA